MFKVAGSGFSSSVHESAVGTKAIEAMGNKGYVGVLTVKMEVLLRRGEGQWNRLRFYW